MMMMSLMLMMMLMRRINQGDGGESRHGRQPSARAGGGAQQVVLHHPHCPHPQIVNNNHIVIFIRCDRLKECLEIERAEREGVEAGLGAEVRNSSDDGGCSNCSWLWWHSIVFSA